MLPMMLQNLMLALVAVADAFMLGGMDQNYMSAVSLATQIQFIQNMLLSAATGGLAILGAQYWGRGNIKTLDDIFCMALRLCGLVSIAFFIACKSSISADAWLFCSLPFLNHDVKTAVVYAASCAQSRSG